LSQRAWERKTRLILVNVSAWRGRCKSHPGRHDRTGQGCHALCHYLCSNHGSLFQLTCTGKDSCKPPSFTCGTIMLEASCETWSDVVDKCFRRGSSCWEVTTLTQAKRRPDHASDDLPSITPDEPCSLQWASFIRSSGVQQAMSFD